MSIDCISIHEWSVYSSSSYSVLWLEEQQIVYTGRGFSVNNADSMNSGMYCILKTMRKGCFASIFCQKFKLLNDTALFATFTSYIFSLHWWILNYNKISIWTTLSWGHVCCHKKMDTKTSTKHLTNKIYYYIYIYWWFCPGTVKGSV